MDRATKKDYNPCGGCYYGCDYEVGESDNPCETVNGYNRAVLLEDILGDNYDIDRLRELVEADRNGCCVTFPCKVGDTINLFEWSQERGVYIISDIVTSVTANRNGWTVKTKSKFYPIKQKDGYSFAMIEEYPTACADYYVGPKEVAEAALQEEQRRIQGNWGMSDGVHQ